VTVGVVIPVRTIKTWLGAAVLSAVAQSEGVYCVVVDDGDNDASLNQVYANTIHLPTQRGLGIARNTGAAYLNTEYLLFLDADDTLYEGMLTPLRQALEENPHAAFAYGNYTQAGQLVRTPKWEPSLLAKQNVASYCNLWRREAFWKLGGYSDVAVAEDWELQRRAAKADMLGAKIDFEIFDHRLHDRNKWDADAKQYGGMEGVAAWLAKQSA
jgi:glycosyltransferase involved in cell wall biosynthesis